MTAEQIKNYVTQYCTVTGRKPLILVDYLQNLTPETDPAAIRANVEQAVRALKAIANELGLSVIAISALNRDNYGKPLNLAAQDSTLYGFLLCQTAAIILTSITILLPNGEIKKILKKQ